MDILIRNAHVRSDAPLFHTDVAGWEQTCVIICATVRITLEYNNDLMTGNSD
jgi:hypothetical protein